MSLLLSSLLVVVVVVFYHHHHHHHIIINYYITLLYINVIVVIILSSNRGRSSIICSIRRRRSISWLLLKNHYYFVLFLGIFLIKVLWLLFISSFMNLRRKWRCRGSFLIFSLAPCSHPMCLFLSPLTAASVWTCVNRRFSTGKSSATRAKFVLSLLLSSRFRLTRTDLTK